MSNRSRRANCSETIVLIKDMRPALQGIPYGMSRSGCLDCLIVWFWEGPLPINFGKNSQLTKGFFCFFRTNRRAFCFLEELTREVVWIVQIVWIVWIVWLSELISIASHLHDLELPLFGHVGETVCFGPSRRWVRPHARMPFQKFKFLRPHLYLGEICFFEANGTTNQ